MRKNLKILLVHSFFSPVGGAELVVYNTFKLLKEKGEMVCLFSSNKKPYFEEDYEYKIEEYDPNYSGVRKYINVTRNKFEDIDEITNVIADRYEYRFNYLGTDVGTYLSCPNIAENL